MTKQETHSSSKYVSVDFASEVRSPTLSETTSKTTASSPAIRSKKHLSGRNNRTIFTEKNVTQINNLPSLSNERRSSRLHDRGALIKSGALQMSSSDNRRKSITAQNTGKKRQVIRRDKIKSQQIPDFEFEYLDILPSYQASHQV